jgi:hypothetical protein
MNALTRLRAYFRESWQRHQRKQKLRRELAEYRSPAERAELEAILARYDTTVAEILRSVDRPVERELDDPLRDVVPTLDLSLIPRPRGG